MEDLKKTLQTVTDFFSNPELIESFNKLSKVANEKIKELEEKEKLKDIKKNK